MTLKKVPKPEPTYDWRRIQPPARLARRPRDQRGFVIPFSVDDGTDHPDFTHSNPERVRSLLETRDCWLCGMAPDFWMCFIGGPISVRNHLFTDGWMHEACAVYAIRVCPYLASPSGRYRGPNDDPRLESTLAPNRPSEFGMAFTHTYETTADEQGLLLRSAKYKKVRWYSSFGTVIRTVTGGGSVLRPAVVRA